MALFYFDLCTELIKLLYLCLCSFFCTEQQNMLNGGFYTNFRILGQQEVKYGIVDILNVANMCFRLR